MAKKRGKPAIFDFGFDSIDELEGRCKKEAGHPAPRAHEFQEWITSAQKQNPGTRA